MVWIFGVGIFLFLLFVFPRAMGTLIVLCGVVIGGFFMWDKNKTDARARSRASVTVTVNHDLEQCSPEFPLLVRIFNGSDNIVEKVSFGIEGTRIGHSAPLYESGYLSYSSDKILASGEGWANCWTLPRKAYGVSEQKIVLNPPETQVWIVSNSSPTFRYK